jgi:hypothetical protein
MVARASRLFPDDRQRTLLRAALLPGPGAREAWRAAAAWLDPARIDPGSRQLLPLVWANLTGQGIHDPALEPLAGFYRDTRVRVEALLAAAARPLAGLRAAGIPTLVLKGGALVSRYYCDTGLRPMSDLDVLVPTPAAPAAQQVLQDHGWSPRFRWSALGVRMTHAAVFDGTQEAPVDLHWHVFAECCRPDDDASLWERSIAIEIGGVPTRALSPADQLLHVCVHGEKWVHVPGIRWVADAVTVMRAAAVIDWEHLVEEATRRRFVRRLRGQLAYLRHTVDAAVPAEVLAALAAAPVSHLERLEHGLGVGERLPSNSLLAHWFTHARSARAGAVGALFSFPRYLQAIWHLERVSAVPGAAVARVRRRLPARPASRQ